MFVHNLAMQDRALTTTITFQFHTKKEPQDQGYSSVMFVHNLAMQATWLQQQHYMYML